MHYEVQFLGRKENSNFGSTHFNYPILLNSLRAELTDCQGKKAESPHASLWTAHVHFQPPAA